MAADKLTVELKGFDDVIDRLQVFPSLLQKRGARAAARKAMIPVRDAARAAAKLIDDPITKNQQIWRNIVINESQRGGKRVGGIVMRVGVRGGALSKVERTKAGGVGQRGSGRVVKVFAPRKTEVKHPGGDTRHWRFVELGYTPKGGSAVPARPFMRPALQNNISTVIDEFAKELDVQIAKMFPSNAPKGKG